LIAVRLSVVSPVVVAILRAVMAAVVGGLITIPATVLGVMATTVF
jgi:hypothetical protein